MIKAQQLKSLTALRFLFFLCVFLSHYMINGSRVLPNGGAFAVVFFFVLSGFSLSFGYGDRLEQLEYKKFVAKRLFHLWPMQVVTVFLRAIPILVIPFLAGCLDYKNLVSFVLKLFFLEAWIPDAQIIFNFNFCAWYLSPLVFCYFIFPFLYKWIDRTKKLWVAVAIVFYLLLYIACAIAVSPERCQIFLYVAPYFRFFDFAIGILLFRIYKARPVNAMLNRKFAAGGNCILLSIVALVAWTPLKNLPCAAKMAAVYWVPAAVVILGFAVLDKANEVILLRSKWLQAFGAASYEMYMTHLFLVSIFERLAVQFVASDDLYMKVVLLFLCLTCSILLGLAVRKWFNIPISNYIKRKFL